MKIMQGDSYPIPVEITQDGVIVTPEMVEEVEVAIGKNVRKTYTTGGVTYADNTWYFQLTQEESFELRNANAVVVRLKYPVSGYTKGIPVGYLNVTPVHQKVVI